VLFVEVIKKQHMVIFGNLKNNIYVKSYQIFG